MLNNLGLQKNLSSLSAWKEFLTSLLVMTLCLMLFSFFPAQDFFQKTFRSIFFLLLIPLGYLKLILKKDLNDFGFSLPKNTYAPFWGIGLLVLLGIIFGLLIKFTGFSENYFLAKTIRQNFWAFLFYELVAFNFLFLLQEFFFKGFVLFALAKKIQAWSVLATALIYCLILILADDFSWQMTPLIIYSWFGSLLAYKNNSFWLSYFVGLFFLISLDTFLIYISK